MRLLELFEQLDRLDEAAIDRYLQPFEGILGILNQFIQVPEGSQYTYEDLEQIIQAMRKRIVSLMDPTGSEQINFGIESAKWSPMEVARKYKEAIETAVRQGEPEIEQVPGTRNFQQVPHKIPDEDEALYQQFEQAYSALGDPREERAALKLIAEIKEKVRGAMEMLGRADRITWYLRWYKLHLLGEVLTLVKDQATKNKIERARHKEANKISNLAKKYEEDLKTQVDTLEDRISKLRSRADTEASQDAIEAEILNGRKNALHSIWYNGHAKMHADKATIEAGSTNFNTIWSNLRHFMQMATMIPAIDEIRFANQTPRGLDREFQQLEKEWRDKMGRFIAQDEVHEDTEVLIEFPDGSQWVNLHKRQCEIEARSMGHCGNVNWGKDSDLVLSYREPMVHPETNEKGWASRLSFILDTNDDKLGEMKGFKNQKPSSKYHDKIIELVKLPLIKGLKGGGHAPQNNFSLADLTDEQREELMAARPDLENSAAGIVEAYEANDRAMNESIFDIINEKLEEFRGLTYIDGWKNDELIIDKNIGDVEDVYSRYSGSGYDDGSYWDPDSDIIEKVVEEIDDDDAETIRKYMILDYIRRETALEKTPDSEIIEEIHEASKEQLFDDLKEYDDELWDALIDSMKATYKHSVQAEQENYVESANEYGGGDGAQGYFERDGDSWSLVVSAEEFMEHVAPMIDSGDDTYGRSWGDVLGIYLMDASENMHEQLSYDNDWFIESSVTEFTTSKAMKNAIDVVSKAEEEKRNHPQMELF